MKLKEGYFINDSKMVAKEIARAKIIVDAHYEAADLEPNHFSMP